MIDEATDMVVDLDKREGHYLVRVELVTSQVIAEILYRGSLEVRGVLCKEVNPSISWKIV